MLRICHRKYSFEVGGLDVKLKCTWNVPNLQLVVQLRTRRTRRKVDDLGLLCCLRRFPRTAGAVCWSTLTGSDARLCGSQSPLVNFVLVNNLQLSRGSTPPHDKLLAKTAGAVWWSTFWRLRMTNCKRAGLEAADWQNVSCLFCIGSGACSVASVPCSELQNGILYCA